MSNGELTNERNKDDLNKVDRRSRGIQIRQARMTEAKNVIRGEHIEIRPQEVGVKRKGTIGTNDPRANGKFGTQEKEHGF